MTDDELIAALRSIYSLDQWRVIARESKRVLRMLRASARPARMRTVSAQRRAGSRRAKHYAHNRKRSTTS